MPLLAQIFFHWPLHSHSGGSHPLVLLVLQDSNTLFYLFKDKMVELWHPDAGFEISYKLFLPSGVTVRLCSMGASPAQLLNAGRQQHLVLLARAFPVSLWETEVCHRLGRAYLPPVRPHHCKKQRQEMQYFYTLNNIRTPWRLALEENGFWSSVRWYLASKWRHY